MEGIGARGAAGSRTAGAYVLRRTAQEVRIWKRRECIAGGGSNASKKLLAALAVLAVALVALTAVSAVASESDAAEPAVKIIAAGYVGDAATADSLLQAIDGNDYNYINTGGISTGVMFTVFDVGGSSTSVSWKVSGNGGTYEENGTFNGGIHVFFDGNGTKKAADASNDAYDGKDTYSIELAVGSAKETVEVTGSEVKFYDDVEFKGEITIRSEQLTIDINGKDITGIRDDSDEKVSKIVVDEGASLVVTDSGAEKGKLELNRYTKNHSAFVVYKDASLELSGIKLRSNGTALFPNGDASKLVVKDSKITGGAYAIATNASVEYQEYQIAIEVSDSEIAVTETDSAAVMINVKNAKLDMTDSVINAKKVGLFVRSGTATVSNTVVNYDDAWASGGSDSGTGADGDLLSWGSGTQVTAAAVLVGNMTSTAYAGTAKLTMSGGEIKAVDGRVLVTTTASNENHAVDVIIGSGTATKITTGTGNDAMSVSVKDLKYKAEYANDQPAPLVIKKGSVALSGTIEGLQVVTGEVTLADDLVIAEGATLVIAEGATLTILSGKSIAGAGDVVVKGALKAEGDVGQNVAVTVEEGASVTGAKASEITNITYTDDAIKTVIIAGGEIADANYGAGQRVEVTADTTVTGDLVVKGVLNTSSGVTVTIAPTGSVTIMGASTSVVDGTLVLKGDDEGTADLKVIGNAVLQIKGALSVAGDLIVVGGASIEFLEGADANVGGVFVATDAVIKDSATLTISGAVKNVGRYGADGNALDVADASSEPTEFNVSGTLNVVSDDISDSFAVYLKTDGAKVDIQKAVLGLDGQAGGISNERAAIVVIDAGIVIYDKKNSEAVGSTDPLYIPGFYDTGAYGNITAIVGEFSSAVTTPLASGETYGIGAEISGITVSTAVKETKIAYDSSDEDKCTKNAATGAAYGQAYKGNYEHAYTMTVSGNAAVKDAVIYSGSTAEIEADACLSIEVAGRTGAEIGETVLSKNIKMEVGYDIEIVGTVALAAATSTDSATDLKIMSVDVSGEEMTAVTVSAQITLGTGATIYNSGKLIIEAAVDATAKTNDVEASIKNYVNSSVGVIELSGEGSIAAIAPIVKSSAPNSSLTSDELAGAVYSVSTGTGATATTVYYYTSADVAVAALNAGSTDSIELFGEQSITATATIASGDTVKLASGAKLTIGSAEATDVVLTIASGASLRTVVATAGQIDVEGTLYAEKKTDIQSSLRGDGVIVSDVYSYEVNEKSKPVSDGWSKWTNLANALSEAKAGQTIEIQKDAELEGTIPEGVTVKSGDNTLTVKQKKSVTIDGVLDIAGGKLVLEPAVKNVTTNAIETAAGAVRLNGQIVYDARADITMGAAEYTIAGAYYSVDSENRISTPAYAAGIVSAVDGQRIDLYSVKDARDNAVAATATGTVDLGAISFTGKSAEDPAYVVAHCNIVSSGISLSDASFAADAGMTVNAVFIGADAKITVVGTAGTGFAVSETAYSEEVADVLVITGAIGDAVAATPVTGDSSVSFEGAVYAVGDVDLLVDSVAVDGRLSLVKTGSTGAAVDAAKIVVKGTLAVLDGSVLTVGTSVSAGSLTVEGDLAVKKGTVAVQSCGATSGSLLVSGNAVVTEGSLTVDGTTTVSGSVDATALNTGATAYAAVFSTIDLYVGTTKKTVGADASVTGGVTVSGYAVVAPGSVAPAVFGGDALMPSASYKKTVFKVDGAEYITVYAPSTVPVTAKKINDFKAEKENAKFENWQYVNPSNGKLEDVPADSRIGTITVEYPVTE